MHDLIIDLAKPLEFTDSHSLVYLVNCAVGHPYFDNVDIVWC